MQINKYIFYHGERLNLIAFHFPILGIAKS